MPGIIVQSYYFSIGTIYQITFSIFISFFCEIIGIKLCNYSIKKHIKNYSWVITATLIALSIPPLSPWWMVACGTFFAIFIAKYIYGGLGENIFNPAMTGYAILLISFPIQIAQWINLKQLQNIDFNYVEILKTIFIKNDLFILFIKNKYSNLIELTQATPLDLIKTKIFTETMNNQTEFINHKQFIKNNPWIWINIAYCFGGLLLILFKIINWRIPTIILVIIITLSLISWNINPNKYMHPLIHMFSGSTMIGVFFIATDPVTSTTNKYGLYIYTSIIGFLIWIIRTYSNYPDSIAFAILLSNSLVPIINYYIFPKTYGHKK
ncbi:MAG: RnfABCDGE type electron transport complex subunit D [Arsenophonus sp.]|nr:MAG: RnfABCDGE type electron transport complex subunit D [Arsenophonus sp.]